MKRRLREAIFRAGKEKFTSLSKRGNNFLRCSHGLD